VKRREFMKLLAGGLGCPLAAQAQTSNRIPRVGILSPAESDASPIFQAFRQGSSWAPAPILLLWA
jgi:hypothetical protein